MKKSPPKYALRFLQWFCRSERIEEVEGDLIELFELRLSTSLVNARLRFIWDVLRSFRWINLRKPSFLSFSSILFKSYLVVGVRNIRKDLHYALLNIIGLSTSLAIFIIMILMAHHEFTFDQFHSKSDRIYEVIQEFQNMDGADPEIFTALPLSEALRNEMPIVENAVTIHSAASTWFEVNEKKHFEEDGIVAGPQFFELFDFKLKYGDPETAMSNKRSIVLDEDLAEKLFGYNNPIGEVINIERYGLFTVSGILEKLPANSFIQFNFIITQDYEVFYQHVASWFPEWFQSWDGDPAATFVLLGEGEDPERFEGEIIPILEKYIGKEEYLNPHYLVNLEELHFTGGIDGSVNRYLKGDISQIRILILVAAAILIMACFNYINITVTRSIKRSKEVGVRKSMGAFKDQIAKQFITESFLQVFIAFLISIFWVYLILPYFNLVTGIYLDINPGNIVATLPYLIATFLIVSIISGSYPAFILSRYSVVRIFRNKTDAGGNKFLRSILLMIQFCLVLVMLTSLLIINQQYQYLRGKKLGINTDQLLVIEINGGGVRNNYQKIKNELILNSQISGVTGLTRMISGYRSSVGVFSNDLDNPDQQYPMRFYGMDEDGLNTLEILLESGSDFSGQKSLDSSSVILNQTAAELYGGHSVIGEWITISDEEGEGTEFRAKVIGVVRDFHYRSLHESIGPVVIGYYINPFQGLDDIVVRLSGNDLSSTLSFIEEVHNKYDENDIMTWEFMDDMIQKSYMKEQLFLNVFVGGSIIALVIALLGIIGLISYNIVSRSKELGIRKVLGAGYLHLLSLQGKTYLIYLLLAAVVVTPLIWIFASSWLNEYAYRINLTSVPFLVSVILILFCTVLTIWLINHRTIRTNAVEALRNE